MIVLELKDDLAQFIEQPDRRRAVSLITAAADEQNLEIAKSVYHTLQKRNIPPDIYICGALLNAFRKSGQAQQAFAFVEDMKKQSILLNSVCARVLIKLCVENQDADFAARLLDTLLQHPPSDRLNVIDYTQLIQALKQSDKSAQVLTLMDRQKVSPNEITYLSLLDSCNSPSSLQFGRMIHSRLSNSFSGDLKLLTALMKMYSRCGALVEARQIFEGMRLKKQLDVVSWTTIILAYMQYQQPDEGLKLFQEMQTESVKPDSVLYASIFSACGDTDNLKFGTELYNQLVKNGTTINVPMKNAFLAMNGKCGNIQVALDLFNEMYDKDEINVVGWTAMMVSYIRHDKPEEVFKLYKYMQQDSCKPNEVTFSTVLAACADAAAWTTGKQVHMDILNSTTKQNVVVKTALLDMYAKCGNINVAREIFSDMHKKKELTLISWNAMLAALSVHGKGKEALKLLNTMQLENIVPDSVSFLSVLNACSHAGLTEAALEYDTNSSILITVESSLLCNRNTTSNLQQSITIVLLMHLQEQAIWTGPKPSLTLWNKLMQ